MYWSYWGSADFCPVSADILKCLLSRIQYPENNRKNVRNLFTPKALVDD